MIAVNAIVDWGHYHYWYVRYSKQELRPWVDKVKQMREQTKILRIYFNNRYGKAVVNAMQFKEMNGLSLSAEETKVLERAQTGITRN